MPLAVLLFPISGGHSALPVPSLAAISLLSLLYSPKLAPLWDRHDLRVTWRFHPRQAWIIYWLGGDW
jgi:hypothetical protein